MHTTCIFHPVCTCTCTHNIYALSTQSAHTITPSYMHVYIGTKSKYIHLYIVHNEPTSNGAFLVLMELSFDKSQHETGLTHGRLTYSERQGEREGGGKVRGGGAAESQLMHTHTCRCTSTHPPTNTHPHTRKHTHTHTHTHTTHTHFGMASKLEGQPYQTNKQTNIPSRTSLNWHTFSLGMPLGLWAVPVPPRAAITWYGMQTATVPH